ncbi:MAG: DUF4252 domain-containing protein [Nonlabens sp.]
MKKLLYTAVFLATIGMGTAQNLNSLASLDNMSETVVTDEMFKLIAMIDVDSEDPEFREMKTIVDNLKELRIYMTDNPASGKKMKTIVDSYISKNNLVKLMHVKEDDQMFTFHMRKGSSDQKVRDLVMFIDGGISDKVKGTPLDSESIFLIISGDIDMNQISKITKQLNTPGQKQIEKATKNN